VSVTTRANLCLPGLLAVLCIPWVSAAQTPSSSPGVSPDILLYRQLRSVGLDVRQTFQVREAVLDREDLHMSLQDGTLAFTQAVNGRITGAFFEGEGELLLIPPDQAERTSLTLFTGAAVLEEKFSRAYLRFSDDAAAQLAPALRPAPDAAAFVERWNPIAESLAAADALRLLELEMNQTSQQPQRLLHARVSGDTLGVFDVYFDSGLPEEISVAQAGFTNKGVEFYDLWLSFPDRSSRARQSSPSAQIESPFLIPDYRIRAHVTPPHDLEAEARVTIASGRSGLRMLVLELSRYLKISSVTLAGRQVEFIQNEAIPGSALARRGNDVMAVLLPRALASGEKIELLFTYAGSVMTEAGGGLMYVGARGAWYPNRGPAMASFDMEFRYPSGWTLVATGARISQKTEASGQLARFRSTRPIPLAGFNLGQYNSSEVRSGPVEVATYAARGVEKNLTSETVTKQPRLRLSPDPRPLLTPTAPAASIFAPSIQLKAVEQRAVSSLDFYSERLGAFPYSSLSLAQMPGPDSQGWPGLIFLSSYAFLPASERPAVAAADAEYDRALYDQLMPMHEIAHQWWGDSVLWATYRDQWLMESLANYCALLQIESSDPEKFHRILEHYRQHLLHAAPRGVTYADAGPVTLGVRLASSRFPDGYETVAYERGSWLMHMLRTMMSQPGATHPVRSARTAVPAAAREQLADPFVSFLRKLQERFAGGTLSTAEFKQALEQEWPAALRYEGKPSLDWFFENWVNGSAIPKLGLRDVHLTQRGALVATGTLTQQDAPAALVTSVPVYAVISPGEKMIFAGRVFADGNESDFKLNVPVGTTRLVLDPYQTILRRP